MAANHIEFDQSTNVGRQLARGLQMVKEGRDILAAVDATIVQMRDGDGSVAAHYDVATSELGVVANDYGTADDATKALYDELASLMGKINTDNAVSNVKAAIDQACAKLAVIVP